MSSVTSTTSTTGTDIAANPAGYTAKATKKVLDSDDFMKLLSVQMANQDPLKPQDDTAFISQMASFSSLSQMNQLTKDFAALRTDQSRNTATSYLGMQVTVLDSDKQSVSGLVTGVDTATDTAQLEIDGNYYPITSVTRVEFPPVTTTTP
jgi:flagellar basal-body rod modification protein FlgD